MSDTVVGFGELLLRLSPPARQLIAQAQSLDLVVGGAEANVLAGLTSLGRPTRMVSRVADNPLGRRTVGALAAAGIDTSAIAFAPGRMGLYFLEAGQGARASAITYDRADSTFARSSAEDFDFAAALRDARLLHISGITPALGAASAEACLAAARTARANGVAVSFDGNYRPQLWAAWDSRPTETLCELVEEVDLLFGNHRDVALLTGRIFAGEGPERRREAADAAFDRFPNLSLVASTARHVVRADHHEIAARVDRRDGAAQTEAAVVTGIVDRIGTGDAFAAGVIDGWLADEGVERMAAQGFAMSVLKHSLPGDFPLFTRAHVAAFEAQQHDVRR